MVITSKNNVAVRELAALKEKKFRDERGTYLVEGFKMIREAVEAKKTVVRVMGTEAALSTLGELDCDVLTATEDALKRASDCKTPQGVVAEIKKEDFGKEKPSGPCVLLDGVSDPGNMGTIERTCAAIGVKDIYLIDCCDPYSPKCVRSSMSGLYSVCLHFINRSDVREVFSDSRIIACDMDGESVFDYLPKTGDKFCLVVGNEANGISEEVKKLADDVVKLPMTDKIESLNVGVALSVALYEMTVGKNGKLID